MNCLDVQTNKCTECYGFYTNIHLCVATTAMHCDLNVIFSQKEELLFRDFSGAAVKTAGCQKEQIYSSLFFFEASLASTNDTAVAAILAGSVINWMVFLHRHNGDHDNPYECERGISPRRTRRVRVVIKCKLLVRSFVISWFKYAVVLFMFRSTIICHFQRPETHSWSLETAALETNHSCWM